MFSNIGIPGLFLILVIALIVFGPKKLPEIGSALGRTISEFRRTASSIIDDDDEVLDANKNQQR